LILYVNGDSHSYGEDAGGLEYSYGKNLSNKLNATFVCDARSAASNDRIIRTTREYLTSNRPDIIVIGWSAWEREEWEYNGEKFDVNGTGLDTVPDALHQRYKEWVANEATDWWSKEQLAYKNIVNFHQELSQLELPHLFFNCYSYFEIIGRTWPNKYDWGINYIGPYDRDQTYYFWLEKQGFKPSNPKYDHYGADAHVAWADFLYPFLTKLL